MGTVNSPDTAQDIQPPLQTGDRVEQSKHIARCATEVMLPATPRTGATRAGVRQQNSHCKKITTLLALCVCGLLAIIPAGAAPVAGSAQPWTLDACIRTALEKHGDAQAASDNVQAASAQLRGAGSALFYPKLSAESSRTEGQTETEQQNGSTSEQQNRLRLSVTFWDGGVQRQNVRKARAGEETAEAALQRTRQTLTYEVTDAYLGLLRARHTLQVAEEKLQQTQAQKAMIEAKVQAGAAAEVDVYPVDVQIASARVDQIKAAGDVRGEAAALRNAMGLDPGTVPEVAELPEQLPEAPPLAECLKQAQEQRPELRQARAGREQQQAGLNLARLQLRPQLSIGGSLDRGLGGTSVLNQWQTFATVAWSFYNRADRANVDAAQATVSAAEAQEEQQVKDVATEVEQAYLALTSARERVTAGAASVAMARKNLEVAEAKYKQGLAIPIEIVDAQIAFRNAQLEAISARYDCLLSRAQLDRAIGQEVAR